MNTQTRTNGYIRLYIGPMFSGKTSALIEAYTRHSIGQRKCLLIKYALDTRYDPTSVVTHDGRKIASCIVCQNLYEADKLVNDYQVVCIDEVQFYDDAPIFCDKWANEGLIVEASGLCGTYARSEFPVISKLIPLSEEVYKKSAVCRETGKDAQFTFRTSDDIGTIVIGGADKYKPVDRETYFSDKNLVKKIHMDAFTNFVNIYCVKNGCSFDESTKSRMMSDFENVLSTNVKICYNEFIERYTKKQ